VRTTTSLLSLVLVAATAAAQSPTGFLDRTVTVGGSSYRYQVYVPGDYNASQQRWPVILFLHGGGERGADGVFQTQVGIGGAIRSAPSKWPAIVVMPQVPSDSLWLGVPSDIAIAALDRTMAEFRTDPDRVYLTGMSLGGNGTWNLAYRFPERFAAIAPVCAFISPFSRLRGSRSIAPESAGDQFAAIAQRLKAMPMWIFHGEIDPVVSVEESRKAVEALRAAGATAMRYTEFLGATHNVWDMTYASPQFRDWLFAQRRTTR
jgi:predicted peptidase